MLPRAIALVPGETIRGEFQVEFLHETVSCHLRNHARSGDGKRQPVTLHQCLVGDWQAFHREPIHQCDVGYFGKRIERESHGLVRRPQDVDLINLLRPDQGYGPNDARIPGDLMVEDFPPPLREFLGIVK